MSFPTPGALFTSFFDRLAAPLALPPALLRTGAGAALLAATAAIALRHSLIGGGLLLAALLLEGLEQAVLRRADGSAPSWLPLGVLLPPFGFALAEPSSALAAMFLMLGLSVMTLLRGRDVSAVTGLVAMALLAASMLPDYFSLLAYLAGITCFVSAGQGLAKGGQ